MMPRWGNDEVFACISVFKWCDHVISVVSVFSHDALTILGLIVV